MQLCVGTAAGTQVRTILLQSWVVQQSLCALQVYLQLGAGDSDSWNAQFSSMMTKMLQDTYTASGMQAEHDSRTQVLLQQAAPKGYPPKVKKALHPVLLHPLCSSNGLHASCNARSHNCDTVHTAWKLSVGSLLLVCFLLTRLVGHCSSCTSRPHVFALCFMLPEPYR